MVGFKTVLTLLILLVFAACVPQTKSTSCKSNESFNSTLRKCVPIVNGPSSFINITTYSPTSTLVKYKSDFTQIVLRVDIDDPYNAGFTVEWERVFNGVPTGLNATSQTASSSVYAFAPASLSSQIGIHSFQVRIVSLTGNVVDSQNFQVIINNNPKPIIKSTTVVPALYNINLTPLDLPQAFQFTIENNGATIAGAGYRTDWELYRSGALFYTETDNFVDPSTNGTNFANMSFNPSVLGAGSYIIRARVTNTAGEVVDEHQWSATVAHPPVQKITARNIYQASTTPVFTTVTTAYNGVNYTLSPTLNFIPVGQTTQADYCVTVASGEGTYAGDGKFVRVDFYLDGSPTLAYSGITTAVDPTICLTDSPDLSNVTFSNGSPTVTQTHSIVARVIDERTNTEYASADMQASLGTYPVTWNVSVRPTNAAPVTTFTANANLAGITCGVASANARTCAVTQDVPFTVGLYATDDFYSTASTVDSVQDKFTYTMTLNRNGTPISTCTKTITDVSDGGLPGSDYVGPDYLCSFTVPSYDASGSVNPTAFTYNVSVVFADVGSPVAGSTPMQGTTLNYNLNVSETNSAPIIDPQGPTVTDSYLAVSTSPATVLTDASVDTGAPGTFITEGETLNINVVVSDAERDDHQIKVYHCTDGIACATTSLVATQAVNKTNNVLTTQTLLTYPLPENLVPVNTAINANVDTYFKVEVTDLPDTVGLGVTVATGVAPVHFNVNVRNKNPAPQFGGTPTPAIAAAITTMVGLPISIDPGTVTDTSAVATENVLAYQWYIDPTGGDDSYTAITGATSRILKWTPTNAIPSGTTVNLALCISDNTTVNPQPAVGSIGALILAAPAANGSNCIGSWDVIVKQNALAVNFNGAGVGVDTGNDIAVWQDTTVAGKRIIYSAYNDSAGFIYIEKTVFDAAGNIYNSAVNGFQTVRFDAIDGTVVSPSTIKDISLSGTDSYLYIAYQAAPSSNPGQPKIRVRRIDKRSGGVVGSKTDPTYHDAAKFGFRYTQSIPTTNNIPSISITATSGVSYSVDFNAALLAGDTVTIHGVIFTAVVGGAPMCAGGGASGCSDNGNAALLAAAINSSTDRRLQGVTAYNAPATSVVTITGDVGGESADANATILGYVPNKLGKIVTYFNGASWEWHLPFVDAATGASQNRIRVLTAGAEAANILGNPLVVTDTVIYANIGQVNWFTNDIFGGGMLIGSIDTSSIAKLNIYPMGSSAPSSTQTLYSGAPVAAGSLRIAAAVPGNSYHFAAAKVLVTAPATYEWKMGRYDASLVPSVQQTFAALAYNPASTAVLDYAHVGDVSIEALPSAGATTEARLLVSSNNGTADYDLFAIRFRSDNYLSCDLCVPLTYGAQELSATKRIATAKIDRDMAIGSTAGVPVDRDVLFAAYHVDDDADLLFKPHMGIFNIEVESLSTTSTSSAGTEGFRPPFIGN